MRRFATWITGHRKTVIIGWIVALIVVGMLAGSVGSDFSEEFKLPASDSQEAFDLLETKFPAQSGETAQIVFKAAEGVESPAVKKKMEGVFAEVAKFPHVSEVASPYKEAARRRSATTARSPTRRSSSTSRTTSSTKKRPKKSSPIAEAAAGGGLQVELGGQPIQEAEEEDGDSSFVIGLLAAIVILLLTFGSVVAMGLPIITALFALGVGLSLVTLGTHVFDTANFAPVLAAMIGLGVGIDYALFILTRFRNALDEGLEPREAAIAAVDTAGRAVLFAGITVIISLMGMLLLGINFLYGVAVAAALAVLFTMIAALTLLPALLDRRPPGRPAADPRPRQALDQHRRKQPLVPLEPRDPAPAGARGAALRRPAAGPLHPDALAAARHQRRRHRTPRGRRRAQAYDLLAEGFGPGFNGPFEMVAALPGKGEDEGLVQLCKTLEDEEGVAASPRSPSTRPRTPASSRSTRRPRRRATTRPSCSTTSATT